jgi:L-asparaginase
VVSTNISASHAKKVVVLGTGGTIAGTGAAPDARAYTSAQLGIETLLQGVPGLSTLLFERQVVLEMEQIAQIDSKDMGFEVWHKLAQRVAQCLRLDDVAGVVITHGTDTLEETAYFLHRVLPADCVGRKPVVITCAMRPATSREADGPQNLHDAIRLASEHGAVGVMAMCAGQIHAALHVQKVHPYRLDAFDSGDAGRLGQVSEGRVTMEKPWPWADSASAESSRAAPAREKPIDLALLAAWVTWPRVEIVTSHAGAGGDLVDALLEHGKSLRGIIVAGTGNGTVHHTLEAALVRAQGEGVRVCRATRCAYGAVQDASGQAHQLPEATTLSPVKARIALMLELLSLDSQLH